MGFDSGAVSFVMAGCDMDVRGFLAKAAGEVVPDMAAVACMPVFGWAGPRHLMDRDVGEGNCVVDGRFVWMNRVAAQRAFPASRMRAEIALEEAAEMAARGVRFLRKWERKEIRDEVELRLLKDAPVGLKGISFVCCVKERVLFTDATSDNRFDRLYGAMVQRARDADLDSVPPVQMGAWMTPDIAARRMGVQVVDLKPLVFSFHAMQPAEMFSFALGREFLTWLLMVAEVGSTFDGWGVFLEGPLVFAGGVDAVEVTVDADSPTGADEAQSALEHGRLLRSARVHLAHGEDVFSFVVDADNWVFRWTALKVEDSGFDAGERLAARVEKLLLLREGWLLLFKVFLELRRDRAEELAKAAQEWCLERVMARKV